MNAVWRSFGALNGAILERPWILVGLMPLVYGVGHTDFKDVQLLTRHPFETLSDPGRQFLHSSPLAIFIGWPVTRVAGANASYLLVTLLGFASLAAVAVAYVRGMPPAGRRTAGLVILSSPLLLVLVQWVGKSDPLLIALYLATLLVRHRAWATMALCGLIVFTHREIGSVMLASDLILRGRARLPIVLGALVGHGLVWSYQSALTVRPAGRVDFAWALMREGHLWQENPVSHLVLGPGWLWIFLARLLGREGAWRIGAALTLSFAAAANTSDYTRDFILCCVPLIAVAAERIGAEGDRSPAPFGWPALFLVQAQIAAGSQLLDATWLR